MDHRCLQCFEKSFTRLMHKYPLNPGQEIMFAEYFEKQMENMDTMSTPEIQRNLTQRLKEFIGVHDLYTDEKRESNEQALVLYDEWAPKVKASDDPYMLALRLAIAGNIMDYGANINFDVNATIETVLKADFAIDHSEMLRNALNNAQKILYLGDNAGEIVFDRLFIEQFGKKVIFAVKSGPVLNDVTYEDARVTGMDDVAEIIENGFDAPSTILHKCSREFRKVYDEADLIISKGQGNFEGLIYEKDPRLFFLLMVKCVVIADHIDAPKNSFIVYNPVG